MRSMPEESTGQTTPTIRVARNGPYIVTGGVPLARQRIVCDAEGEATGWSEGEPYPVSGTYALRRWGGHGHAALL